MFVKTRLDGDKLWPESKRIPQTKENQTKPLMHTHILYNE